VLTFGFENESIDSIKTKMLKYRTECMPILNQEKQLVDVYFWADIFGTSEKRKKLEINLPVVIMAGGKGTRLKPITNVIPKPLIPIGEKTILELIMDKFNSYGVDDFHISVNYKAEMIKYYFAQKEIKEYQINFFEETKPLGTAGSLHLLKKQLHEPFFVTNCDIIIEQDYDEIMNYHKSNNNEMTVVAALKHEILPYGILDTETNGVLKDISEKPERTLMINAGMYILNPELLQEIPENDFYHITHLMKNLLSQKRKVGVFPVSDGAWHDVGEWNKYKQTAFKISGDEF
jgi:NDP-sugar pyrophosphorylase family protein